MPKCPACFRLRPSRSRPAKGENAVGVGLAQGKDLQVPGKAQDLGPGHRRAGFQGSDPEQQALIAQFIGQAQISDAEQLGGAGGFPVLGCHQAAGSAEGAGFLVRPEGQRQGKGPGLVFLDLGGKELLVFPGRGEKNGLEALKGVQGL